MIELPVNVEMICKKTEVVNPFKYFSTCFSEERSALVKVKIRMDQGLRFIGAMKFVSVVRSASLQVPTVICGLNSSGTSFILK